MMNPIFIKVREMVLGLTQIKIFNKRPSLLKEFAEQLNHSLRVNLAAKIIARGFGILINYTTNIFMIIGWIIGIYIVTP